MFGANRIPPCPPIPTAFDMCVSVEEQLFYISHQIADLTQRLEDAGVIPPKEEETRRKKYFEEK